MHEPGRDWAVDFCNCNCDCIFWKRFLYIRKFCILPVEFGIHAFRSDCAGISDGNNCPEQRCVDRNCEYHSLGMCFLGGVFVPLEFMGNDVKAVSQFLPVYWYEKANDILADFGHLTASAKGQFLQAIMIQLVFAAAFVCLVLVVEKYKRVDS